MEASFTMSNSTAFLSNHMTNTHHSGADNSSQIWGLIHHTCYDVVVTERNHWKVKTEESLRKMKPSNQGCTFIHAALLTLCWRLPLLLTNYIKNWLLSMKKNVFYANHLTEKKTEVKNVCNKFD